MYFYITPNHNRFKDDVNNLKKKKKKETTVNYSLLCSLSLPAVKPDICQCNSLN